MIITIIAGWEFKEVRRGITIWKRKARTGTSGGAWMTPGTYHPSLKAAREYIDNLPVGHFCGPNQIVRDSE